MNIFPIMPVQSQKMAGAAAGPAIGDNEGQQQSNHGDGTDIDEQDYIDTIFYGILFHFRALHAISLAASPKRD